MASLQAIATKRVNAVRTIEQASAALAKKFNLEIQPLPSIKRLDAEYGRAVQLAHLADALQKIAVATGAMKADSKTEEIVKEEPIAESAEIEDVEVDEKQSVAPKGKKK